MPTSHPRRPRRPPPCAPRLLGLCVALALPLGARAQATQDAATLASLIEATARQHASGQPGEVGVQLGPQALALPPCAEPEAFMPPGSKPWGDLVVGVRCASGSAWTRFVPVKLSVTVRHAVALRALPAGHALTPQDLDWAAGDLARLPRDVVTDPAALSGALTLQPLAAGAALRQGAIKAQPVILQGQPVRVLTLGPGFTLSAEGKAQAAAAPGQAVAVRMPGGQVISAVARADGSAEKAP